MDNNFGLFRVSSLFGAAKAEASKDPQHVLQDKDANGGNYNTAGMSGSVFVTPTRHLDEIQVISGCCSDHELRKNLLRACQRQ